MTRLRASQAMVRALLVEVQEFDVAVIGGGIQGAGVARDAAQRGLKVFLAEAKDFGHATSSNSSKLVHGGLRYLERFEFGLVKESLQERACLIKIARHLVSPLPLMVPTFEGARRPGWIFKLGLVLYDFLAGRQPLPKHTSLSKTDVLKKFPLLRDQGLRGGLEYFDGQMNDARLVIANIKDAEANGAVCLNYAPVKALRKCDYGFELSIATQEGLKLIRAKCVVNTAGPWVDQVLGLSKQDKGNQVTLAKGVHLFFTKPKGIVDGLFLEVPQDNRIFFVLPWLDVLLVGTTDTLYQGSLETLEATPEDISYILTALKAYIKNGSMDEIKLLGSFAGVRPLVNENRSTLSTSRGYRIIENDGGMWSVVGGKYTVYRKIAALTVDRLTRYLKQKSHLKTVVQPCRSHELPLPGTKITTESEWQELKESCVRICCEKLKLDRSGGERLFTLYGVETHTICELAAQSPDLAKPLDGETSLVTAELVFSVTHEHARTLGDFLMRRSMLFFSPSRGLDAIESVCEAWIAHCQGDRAELEEQKKAYVDHLRHLDSLAALAQATNA